ncbi:coiled-coil domain-containing protein 117 [Mugil cephalus]|uniref:coiled-coil domain-containing protein 117 n=1 Tax=Mugil cephalus TaxID=48193 RepID=UPI001FB6979E|nr:coiled-coil domain-containing protein 117 [Mugil cephalus]XP_047447925.1 coiled-coil domain-containing protein 117 [Mugil cephalus]XP_047447926.1 coiled-coil domain-containing protein 117 [Mugil cephalus]
MHHPAASSRELRFLPAMYSFSGSTNLPEIDLGNPSTSSHLHRAAVSNNWETRCLRKHRRRVDDEGCSAKKRRLMFEAEGEILENSSSSHRDWPTANSCPSLSTQQASPALPQPCTTPQDVTLPQPTSGLSRPETENSCMEIEAAQRKLQEIEDRITLEDDDEDEDLDVEPAQRRPVLVISDSLKEGLQRGISDILPHTVAQSVSHSCMELVLWRPPDDPFSRKLKGSLQKQRKQHTASRHPPTPCPSPSPHSSLRPSSPPAGTRSPLYSFPVAHNSGEEDMEM